MTPRPYPAWAWMVQAVAVGVLTVYTYTILEWLFLATKPSFMSRYGPGRNLAALLLAALPPALIVAVAQAALAGSGNLLRTRLPNRYNAAMTCLMVVIPAAILTLATLLLVDNFTITMFGTGLRDANWINLPLYWIFLVAALTTTLTVMTGLLRHAVQRPRMLPALSLTLVSTSGVALLVSMARTGVMTDTPINISEQPLPNIVFFAADGVPAERTSAYGYPRPTTPNLDRYMDNALVAENAFANAGRTTASLTSMMTGKLPTTTKVLFPPHTLEGVDAYQHLPRLLRRLGYRGIQETIRYYADGQDLNWQQSFDTANRRDIDWPSMDGNITYRLATQTATTLRNRMRDRITSRLIKLIAPQYSMDVYQAVSDASPAKVYDFTDTGRMRRVRDFIDAGDQPFFAHIHLMGTHCCLEQPPNMYFDQPEETSGPDRVAAVLENLIVDTDKHFGDLMSFLDSRGLLDNTLVIYSSDHSLFWHFNERLPLVFLFPGREAQGRIRSNVQLLDVAPTILDYLGQPIPEWLQGRSLLRGEPDPLRPVYGIAKLERERFRGRAQDSLTRISDAGPPNYGLTAFGMVVCNRWYYLDVDSEGVRITPVSGHTSPCPTDQLPDNEQAKAMLKTHLHEQRFQF